MGHNLGMVHDFLDKEGKVPRFDSKGNPCSKIGGIMDYYGASNIWSTCSVEDFTAYYNSVDPYCLAPVG